MYADTETYRDPEKTKKMVFRAVQKSEEAYQPLRETKWPRALLYYYSYHDLTKFRRMVQATGDGGAYPYDVDVFYPTVLEQVETQTPRLVRSLLANEPFLRAKPVMTTDDIAQQATLEYHAELCGQLVQEEMLGPVRLRRHLASWVRDAKIFGLKWLVVDWFHREGKDWKQQPQGMGKWEYMQGDTSTVLNDHIRVTGKSIWDVYPDPRGRSVHGRGCTPGCRYIATKGTADIDEIWSWVEAHPEKAWWFKRRNKENPEISTRSKTDAHEDLKKLQGQVRGKSDKHRELLAQVGMLAETHAGGHVPTEEDKRLITYTDYFEPPGGKHVLALGEDGGKALTALTEDVPIRKLGLPFIAVRPTPVDGQLYCNGVPGMVEGLVHVINATVNLRLHDLKRSVHPVTVVNTDSGLHAADLVFQAVPVFEVDGSVPASEALHIHSYPPATNDSYVELNNMEEHLRNAAGGPSSVTGSPEALKYQPWRGTQAIIQEAGARFALESTQIAEDMAELAWAMHQTNRQMITAGKLVRLHGTDAQPTGNNRDVYRPVYPDILDRDIEIYFDARPEAANPGAIAKAMTEWGKIVFQLPEFSREKFIKDVGKAYGVPRPEQYIKTPTQKAEHENVFFRATGEMPMVSRGDNHGYHLLIHGQLLADGTLQSMNEQAKESFANHTKKHAEYQQMAKVAPPRGVGAPVPRRPAQAAAPGAQAVPLPGGRR